MRLRHQNRRMRLHAWWTRLWHVRLRPSPLQREFNRGDPHGIVRQYADLIIAELEAEIKKEAS